MCASREVLAAAEHLLGRITDQYVSSNLSAQELFQLARSSETDPLKEFGEACRAELEWIRSALATQLPRLPWPMTSPRPGRSPISTNIDASLTTRAAVSFCANSGRFPHTRTRCLHNFQIPGCLSRIFFRSARAAPRLPRDRGDPGCVSHARPGRMCNAHAGLHRRCTGSVCSSSAERDRARGCLVGTLR
jgi:hypothetical protein